MLNKILTISSGNRAIKFIYETINTEFYRGNHISQHNRITFKKIECILKNIYAISKDGLLQIRTTDLSKRPQNITGEEKYSALCRNIKSEIGIGTQDSIRKNFFVDMERMGLIDRFDKYKNNAKKSIKYIKLTDYGVNFLNTKKYIDQFYIFSACINKLTLGYIDIIIRIFRVLKCKSITLEEFMFFVSKIHFKKNNLNFSKCTQLLQEFRTLSRTENDYLIKKIKTTLDPRQFAGNKNQKKDWYNWKNEAQQIFNLLGQTVYFEFSKNKLSTRTNEKFQNPSKLIRSKTAKEQYFKQHMIKKEVGFELHHIFPLGSANSKQEFLIYDNWLNLIYIDAFKHSQLTQTGNQHKIMNFINSNLILENYEKSSCIEFINKKNILYDVHKQQQMLEYNKKLMSIK